MNFITRALTAATLAALLAALVAPGATASAGLSKNEFIATTSWDSNPQNPTDNPTDNPTEGPTEPVEEDVVEPPTRGDVISKRKLFTARATSKNSIKLIRKMAPRSYKAYFVSADYAKWYTKLHIEHQYSWNRKQFSCLDKIWQAESSWRIAASGAGGLYLGIPQMNRTAVVNSSPSVAAYRSSPELQVQIGSKYVKYRYGTPCKALTHKQKKGWY
jgi:hypothetical protein